MNYEDLGPLERAILESVVAAEVLGLPRDVEDLHRFLPGYHTHQRNVAAALAPGRGLSNWLVRSGPYFLMRDRADSAVGVRAGSHRAASDWEDCAGLLRGMAKLPWIEAVAAIGPFAQGYQPTIGRSLDLVVIAEGGRADLARGALAAFRRAHAGLGLLGKPRPKQPLRVVRVLDADQLELVQPDATESTLWASLNPLIGLAAWEHFFASNSWIRDRFPNWSVRDVGVPRPVSERRLDGRLARIRRGRVSLPGNLGNLLRSEGRREGLLTQVEDRVSSRAIVGSDLGLRAVLDGLEATVYGDRLEGIKTWAFDEEPAEVAIVDEQPSEVAIAPDEPNHEPEVPVQPELSFDSEGADGSQAEVDVHGSGPGPLETTDEVLSAPEDRRRRTRRRGARTAPARRGTRTRRSVASDPRGQRGAGRGRKSGSFRG
ncbi:MAG: hypothetical protein VX498_08695 [Myxococcota bacterium]|nr:hypothetical protein [Myxococcota bacterium]